MRAIPHTSTEPMVLETRKGDENCFVLGMSKGSREAYSMLKQIDGCGMDANVFTFNGTHM